MPDYFSYPTTEYKRQFTPIADYINLSAIYISRLSGKDLTACKQWVTDKIRPGSDHKFEIKDPQVKYLSREDTRDRIERSTTLMHYVAHINRKNYIMTPAMHVYVPSYVEESQYTPYIEAESADRSKYKKAMFIAEQVGDNAGVKYNDGMQSSKKISVNNISGAAMSATTVGYTGSLHQSLTSVCGKSTPLANMNNEKLIMGNRPYLSYQFVIDSISTVLLCGEMDRMQTAVDEFNIHLPSVDEVMECITYSSDLYWQSSTHIAKIRRYVSTMTPIERAYFTYAGDLYHFDKHNHELTLKFFNGFIEGTTDKYQDADPDAYYKSCDADVATVARLICKDYLAGKVLDDVKETNPEQFLEIVQNAKKVNEHLDEYANLIMAILRQPYCAAGANRNVMPNMLRRAVLTSDTDSTIYTTQYWIKRISGRLGFDDIHYRIGQAISFFVNKTVFNQLAIMSKNMGAEDKYLHTISMKNEYYFPVYSITNATKTYFAGINIREGNVYLKRKLEKKGAMLRSAKIPVWVSSNFDTYLNHLMNQVSQYMELTLYDVFHIPYTTESIVRRSVANGEVTYYSPAEVKPEAAYKRGPAEPIRAAHSFWETVFAPKYGSVPEPYTALKVSTSLSSKRKLVEWIDQIEDRELAARAKDYFEQSGRKDLNTVYVPQMLVSTTGLPSELISALDVNKQVLLITAPFYTVLEVFGFYLKNDRMTMTICDYYKPETGFNQLRTLKSDDSRLEVLDTATDVIEVAA